jgi:phosphoglycerol transferase MdoB-like AlkP superfamily enzyme
MNILLRTFILLVSFCFVLTTTKAQGNRAPIDEVVNAMKSNRGQGIGRYFDNFVPITINNTQSNYSHNQAELVLKDFFDKNPPKDFTVVNNGAPDNTSRFAIATFNSPNGRYNVYILMRQKDNSYVVKEIRITKD